MKLVIVLYIFVLPLFSFASKLELVPETTFLVKQNRAPRFEFESIKILQKKLRTAYQISDGFEIIPESKAKILDSGFLIAVGKTSWSDTLKLKKLKSHGFSITTIDHGICIASYKPQGTVCGVAYFLDKYCGIRIYMPQDIFSTYPNDHKIKITLPINETVEPDIPSVMSTGFSSDNDIIQGEFDFKLMSGLFRKDWGKHQHTMYKRFPLEKFKSKYPKIYPMKNGVRYFPKGKSDQHWQPDFAEPDLVQASVESTIEYFKTNPDKNHIAFSVMDSHDFSTEGRLGKQVKAYGDTTKKKRFAYTNIYIDYLNSLCSRLEKELPLYGISTPKTIVYIAYSSVRELPTKKLHPWILPIRVFRIAEIKALKTFNNKEYNKLSKPSEWKSITNRIGHHDWVHGDGFLVPRIYTSLWKEYLFGLKKLNMNLEYVHLECYPNWGLDGPKYYILGKLLWDNELKIKRELTQFCKDMFSMKAGKMRGYFKCLERFSESRFGRLPKAGMYDYKEQFNLNKKEVKLFAKCRRKLNHALKGTSGVIKDRITFFDKTFKLSESLQKFYCGESKNLNQVSEIKRYMHELVKEDPYYLYLFRKDKLGRDKGIRKIEKKLLKEI